jgi:hypothetical protein
MSMRKVLRNMRERKARRFKKHRSLDPTLACA